MPGQASRTEGPRPDWDAVSTLYNAFFTGLVLSASMRTGAARAAELVYRIFDRQRERRFLPGLAKLGIDKLPHAVAAAQYHYLSNNIGGVAVQYMPESDRKAWIRYVPPRWAWAGTALCGVPPEVSTAMLRGWHARNGLALGAMAAAVAAALSVAAAWALTRWVFEGRFSPQPVSLAAMVAGVVTLTVVVGLLNSREVIRRTPLEVLRGE